MSTVNKGYKSLFETLADAKLPFFRTIETTFYRSQSDQLNKTGNRRYNHRPRKVDQLIGSLKPLADMHKDFVDTFKPYKSFIYPLLDSLQLFKGIGNIVKGVLNIVVSPVVLVFSTVDNIFYSIGSAINHRYDHGKGGIFRRIGHGLLNFGYTLARDVARSVSWVVDGALSIIRGVPKYFQRH